MPILSFSWHTVSISTCSCDPRWCSCTMQGLATISEIQLLHRLELDNEHPRASAVVDDLLKWWNSGHKYWWNHFNQNITLNASFSSWESFLSDSVKDAGWKRNWSMLSNDDLQLGKLNVNCLLLLMFRGGPGHLHGIFGSYMYWKYFMVLLSNGLCTNMLMMLPVVVLWSYIGDKFCVVLNLNTKINYERVRWVNQYSMQIWLRIAALRCARSLLPF